jgi:hypothetical protein
VAARQLTGLPALLDLFPDSDAQLCGGCASRLPLEICHEQRLCGAAAVTA